MTTRDVIERAHKLGYPDDAICYIRIAANEGHLNILDLIYPKRDIMEIKEIVTGLKNGVDASKYANPAFGWREMQIIRLGLQQGIDVTGISDIKRMDRYQILEVQKGIKSGIDVTPYANHKYDHRQMEMIRIGLERGLDVSQYTNLDLNGSQMEQIRLGLDENVDVALFNNPRFNSAQMEQIRLGLSQNLDASIYADLKFSSAQMYEIRLGLLLGVDISTYTHPDLTPETMCSIRRKLKPVENNTQQGILQTLIPCC